MYTHTDVYTGIYLCICVYTHTHTDAETGKIFKSKETDFLCSFY